MAKRKRNNLWIYVLVLVIAALVALAVIKGKKGQEAEKVTVEKAQNRTIVERVAASGRVFPELEVKMSSDVSGQIVDLLVNEGDSVVQGQILARIDPDAYESQVEQGQARLNSSKAQLANSRAQIITLQAQRDQIVAQLSNAREIHKRNEQLKKEGVVSTADFEQSLSNLQALEANLRSAEANIKAGEQSVQAADFNVKSTEAALKELNTALRRTTIAAPMSGIVSKLSVEQGERVVGTIQMSGTEMMRIADLKKMEVRVDVSENDIPRVSMGDEVDIEVDAYVGRKFKGNVTEIANSATSTGSTAVLTTDQVTNFEVTIAIDPASYADLVAKGNKYPFRPGMSASVEIKTETVANTLTVPIQSVTTRDEKAMKEKDKKSEEDGPEDSAPETAKAKEEEEEDVKEVVFILVPGDSVHMAEITTGVQDDNYIQVLSGLKDGDEVITGPYTTVSRKLKGGMKVQKVKEEELTAKKE